MRLLFLGDIVGRTARETVARQVPLWRRAWNLDLVIANVENAVHGKGINEEAMKLLAGAGVDAMTTGNHAYAQAKDIRVFETYSQLLRPLNFLPKSPGRGAAVIKTAAGRDILVINAIAQVFMNQQVNNPFHAVDDLLKSYNLGGNVAAIILDFHHEASSEIMAMGWHMDGRVSAVIGTHTHLPSADAMILPGGTAFQSDAGMCGDYHSVLGLNKTQAVERFLSTYQKDRKPDIADGPATLCGVYIETDDQTGLAKKIAPVRFGPHLIESLPFANK